MVLFAVDVPTGLSVIVDSVMPHTNAHLVRQTSRMQPLWRRRVCRFLSVGSSNRFTNKRHDGNGIHWPAAGNQEVAFPLSAH